MKKALLRDKRESIYLFIMYSNIYVSVFPCNKVVQAPSMRNWLLGCNKYLNVSFSYSLTLPKPGKLSGTPTWWGHYVMRKLCCLPQSCKAELHSTEVNSGLLYYNLLFQILFFKFNKHCNSHLRPTIQNLVSSSKSTSWTQITGCYATRDYETKTNTFCLDQG